MALCSAYPSGILTRAASGSIRAVLRTIARKALARWRSHRLSRAYRDLWKEWGTEDDLLWETTVGDGLEDEEWPNAPRIHPAS